MSSSKGNNLKKRLPSRRLFVFSLTIAACFGLIGPSVAADFPSSTGHGSLAVPLFLGDLANPHDYSLFANGGWDGNWYVGYNTCWMQKVDAPPLKDYSRAFLGVKLGRMKSLPMPGRPPWEKKAHPGEIYMAISSTPSWSRKQSYFVVNTGDIPLEPDYENAVEGVGEARWFWREIPLSQVQPGAENYLAVWSPSERLTSVSSSPVLAAGWGNKDVNTWLSNDTRGAPPATSAKALATPVTIFEPAIALKLIPADKADRKPVIRIIQVSDGKPRGKSPAPKIMQTIAEGESVERAWVVISTDSRGWKRYGRYAWSAPYTFTLKMEDIPIGGGGKTWVRAAAADTFENIGYSDGINLFERKE